MNYPINVSDCLDIDFAMNLVLFAILAMALIALWFDLRYKPQVYDLVTLLDRRVSSRASEIFKQKLHVTFSESILTQEDYDLKYSLENQAEEIKKSLEGSKYKTPKGFKKETYTGRWIKAEFKQAKKSIKPPYFAPVKILSLEESREIKVGSIELENQAEEIKKSLEGSKYKTPKGFKKETYTGRWIKAEFEQAKKSIKPPYFAPVKILSLEESREIKVGSIELENQAEEIKKSLEGSKYKTPKGFKKETYAGAGVKAEFEQAKKSVKPPYFAPVKILSLDESREINVGSIELEKVYAENL